MTTRSPRRGGSGGKSASRPQPVAPQNVSRQARWQGSPLTRPQTDAEYEIGRARNRKLLGLATFVLGALVAVYLFAPITVITFVTSLIPPRAPAGVVAIPGFMVLAYPFVQYAALLLMLVILVHLIVALRFVGIQQRNRTRAVYRTLDIEVAPTEAISPIHGVDLFVGLQRLNKPIGRSKGREDALVFALVSGSDGRMQLRLRAPADEQRDWTSFLRQSIEGRAPGTTARLLRDERGQPVDDLAVAIDAATEAVDSHGNRKPYVLGWIDLTLMRDAAYPLNDMSQFAADPMGTLAAALRISQKIRYAAYEIIVRAVEDRWRDPVRAQVAQIQAKLSPEDLSAHDALLRKAEQVGYDVVVRCIVIAEDRTSARQHLADMRDALAQFDRMTRGALQRLQVPTIDRLAPGGVGGQVVTLPSRSDSDRPREGRRGPPRPALAAGGGALGGALTGALLASGLLATILPGIGPFLAQRWPATPFQLPPPPLLDPALAPAIPALPVPLAALCFAAIGVLVGLAAERFTRPEAKLARTRTAIAAIRAHAHRFAWPGVAWPLPLPGKRRSVMGAFDLAALWHAPSAALGPLVAYRSIQYLPKHDWVFLNERETQEAEERVVLPEPKTPLELARRRLGIAMADRPDGTLGLIGPTVRDFRKGMECLGPMGSGKSCFIEVIAYELARNGAGFTLVDAKGDLADRLIAMLPRQVQERIILIDVSSPIVPCINPLDRRLLRDGVAPVQIAGQVEQLFARMDPETWPTSTGMQQFVRMGLRALLEGEPEPTLLHLDRFYTCSLYREIVLQHVRNPLVLDFWRSEYPNMDPKLRVSVDSFRRRLQNFITDPLFQQLFCQVDSTLYLPELMDQRRIIIIKLVPEVLSEALAKIVSTALFSTLAAATFARQHREPDPELRWDSPLIIDEIQKFIDAEHSGDAETFFTQTRSLGVGIIGAHQGLYQYSDAVRSAALQSLGSLSILGPIKQDAKALCEAYAETGLSEADFAALRAQKELLIRFPVVDRDSGLLSGIPRRRPPANMASPMLRERLIKETATAAFRTVRPPDHDQHRQDDQLLEGLWQLAAQKGTVAGPVEAADFLIQQLGGRYPPDVLVDLVKRLRARSVAYHRAQAQALRADSSQLPDAALTIREQSALIFGVDPVVNACYSRVLALQYPADPPTPPRGGGGGGGGRPSHGGPRGAPQGGGGYGGGGGGGRPAPAGAPPTAPPSAPPQPSWVGPGLGRARQP